ncbi:MAG: APC family permease [Peptococcaceae bacterium]|jgi:APA family basic amino acid/polyamine antiporter|nr:APC family permease [Peptococcaceae bacterium]
MDKSEIRNEERGKLGFVELWAIGIGQVIGAGVITLIGPAIALTGYSVWLAYFVAVCLGAVTNLPIIIFSSVTKFSGGDYSVITTLGGQKAGGMYIVGFSLQMLGMSLFATALGMYVTSIIPGADGKLIGVIALIFFYFVNLLGIANMARLQKLMSAVLIAALMMFIVVGATKADFSHSFNFLEEGFFSSGGKGFWSAVMLLVYSCQGYKFNANYGSQTLNPTRNLPRSMLAVVPVLMVVYSGAALIGSTVLPLEMVAGQPLTLAARTILPNALFFAFIIGGPIMALLTTINSTFGAFVGPFTKAANDGWFTKKLARTNSRGGAYVILTIELILGLIPVLLDFSVGQIVNNVMLVSTAYNFILYYSLLKTPDMMPGKWAHAALHTNRAVFYTIMAAAFVTQAVIGWNSIKSLTAPLAAFNIAALAVCFIYAIARHASGKTHVDTEGMVELN